MNTSAVRGAAMVAVAVIIGALILTQGLKDSPTSIVAPTTSGDDVATPVPDAAVTPTTVPDSGPAATPTSPAGAVPPPSANPPHDPSEVTVQVANAAGIDGLAGKISTRLGQRNYVMRTATNATATSTSTVYYAEGYDGDAQEILLNVLNTPNVIQMPMPSPPPTVDNPEPAGVNILIIAGSDDLSQL